ncbi:DAHL domain-containing protein [Pseudomonadota bacterium]
MVWWIVLVGLVLLLPFLYVKSQSTDSHSHVEFVREIAALKQHNVLLKQALLETRLGLRPNYDHLVRILNETVISSRNFQADMLSGSHLNIGDEWEKYSTYLDRQKNTIENFKSHYAVLKNSIHYLPLVVDEFIEINSTGERGVELERSIQILLDKVLLLSFDRGFEHLLEVKGRLNTIRKYNIKGLDNVNAQQTLKNIILHVESVLEYKEEVEELLSSAVNAPTTDALDELLVTHISKYDKARSEADVYGVATFIAAAMLVFMVAYVLYRLNATTHKLHDSLTQLNFQKNALDEHAIVSIADVAGRITYANEKFCDISGYSKEDLVGKNHRLIKSDEHSDLFFKDLWKTIANGKVWHGEIRNRSKDGSSYWVKSTIVPFLDKNGKPFQYVSIRTNITARKKMEADLNRAKNEAEVTNKMKSEFLANMSHEIRTPMNAITGLTHLALETDLDDKQKDYLTKISDSANSLLGIINDILDISKIEAGKLSIESVPFNLENILDNVSSTLHVNADKKGIAINVSCAPEVPAYLIGDPLRLRQVLINISGNAVKFTDEGEINIKVKTKARDEAKAVLFFEVEDTGIGIPEAKKEVLFQAFSQADASTTREYGGTGLGLSICKSLVEMMGGTIGIDSEPGKGSTFYFDAQFGITDEVAFKLSGDSGISAKGDTSSIAGAKVLVAEDNELNQQVIREFLARHDVVTTIVENGKKAVQAVKNNQYDIVLMDIQMPEMDGQQATTEIRKESRFDDLPIIAMTAHAMLEYRERYLKSGMNDHIAKPIDPALFSKLLVKWIKPRKSETKKTSSANLEESSVVLPESLPGINMDNGLRLTGGIPRIYAQILFSFRIKHANAIEELRQELDNNDLKSAERRVHTTKSLAAMIGAEGLSEHAYKLEKAICSKEMQEVSAAFIAFDRGLRQVLDSLEAVEKPSK